jgi:hypothetical protein
MLVESALLLFAAPWPTGEGTSPLAERLAPPAGFARVDLPEGSFGAWLRQLPILPGRPDVLLFDGKKKRNQEAHALVADVDVGERDLQQCADAVMRLFAEWQWAANAGGDVCFHFTSGHAVRWEDYARGVRPIVRGSTVRFVANAAEDRGYASFRRYLEQIFTYSGTASLEKDLAPVADARGIEAGDVFIRGGFPGHAVLVADVAENAAGDRAFVLVQSYMPAQQIHVLRNPASAEPWYRVRSTEKLETPEWTFEWSDLRRFRRSGCR